MSGKEVAAVLHHRPSGRIFVHGCTWGACAEDHTIIMAWTEGNWSCDCNRRGCDPGRGPLKPDDAECGDEEYELLQLRVEGRRVWGLHDESIELLKRISEVYREGVARAWLEGRIVAQKRDMSVSRASERESESEI